MNAPLPDSPAGRQAVVRPLPWRAATACLLASAWCCTAAAAEPLGEALVACRAMPDPAARLACYDRLQVPTTATTTGASAGATAAPAGTPAERFGLEQKLAISGAPDQLVSTLPGRFEGWSSNTRFKLANGQVWQVSDGSRAAYTAQDPQVTIRRGALGAFYLSVAGLNKEARVKRVE